MIITSGKKSLLLASLIILAAACQEEPVLFNGAAGCGGCEIPPGGGTVTVPCGDLVVTNFSYTIVKNSYLLYQVELKNIGEGIVSFGGSPPLVSLQAVVSVDLNYSGDDAGACSTSLNGTLLPGQTTTVSFRCYQPEVLSEGNYLVINALVKEGSNDCNPNNNLRFLPL